MAKPGMRRVLLVCAAMALVMCAAVALCVSGGQAHAGTLSVAASPKSKVTAVSAKERAAYKRAVAACMDYANQPNPIVVDMSDLGLTAKQAKAAWNMIHSNGELFWINCYGDTYTKAAFTLPCYYDDAKIDKMRAQFERAIAKALKRIGPGMAAATKVHMLHDYVLDRVDYKARNKTAYTALVKRKGDCFGFTLAMDVLLRRVGFSVDVAFNNRLDHSWNLVKVAGKWYHVDATWDNGYCGQNYSGNFNWAHRRCHLYLLQSDKGMAKKTVDPATGMFIKSHAGWTCHHKCASAKYDFSRDLNAGFYRHCSDYKHIVRGFSKGGVKYRVVGVRKVRVASAARAAAIPATATYRGVRYRVA